MLEILTGLVSRVGYICASKEMFVYIFLYLCDFSLEVHYCTKYHRSPHRGCSATPPPHPHPGWPVEVENRTGKPMFHQAVPLSLATPTTLWNHHLPFVLCADGFQCFSAELLGKKISTVFSSLSELLQYILQSNAMHGTESRLVLILHRSASNAWHSAVMHLTLKGQCHEIFWRSKHFNQYSCVCSVGFQGLSKAFYYPIQLSASLKLLTNFENNYWNPPQNSLLCDWSMFSGASCKHFQCQNHRFRIFKAGSWKDFQNLWVSSREQAKTWVLFYHQLRNK